MGVVNEEGHAAQACSVRRRRVEADILNRLELLASAGGRLPSTRDGKVNVIQLCRDLGLPLEDAQHFHRKVAVKAYVNAIAAEQRLHPIGARVEATPADAAVERRMAMARDEASTSGRAAAEAAAALDAMADALRKARAEVCDLRLERDALEEKLRMLTEHGVLWDPG